ncbi:hypothetical protein ElyMa_003510800 [Elysia marginata]|uniref:Uncharacterized protein n=1 Tax=Elysia marginata TaxID=1093978 RepID=A0AAV4EGY3_9GAST|nr:hypothetical protein ElyMa_003510800 [Elysia marginata]
MKTSSANCEPSGPRVEKSDTKPTLSLSVVVEHQASGPLGRHQHVLRQNKGTRQRGALLEALMSGASADNRNHKLNYPNCVMCLRLVPL